MPNWTQHFSVDCVDCSEGISSWEDITIPSLSYSRQEYEEYQREIEEERQLIKDKEKYPLFFLKGGIV